MGVPKQVSKKLREMLGEEAGGSMADWLESQEKHHEELRHQVRADIDELRQETRADIAELRHEMQVGFARVDARFAETDAKIAALGERMAQQLASGFKWAIGVWISSRAAVVGLMGLMRVVR